MFRFALLVLFVSVASGVLAADLPAPVVKYIGVVSEFPCVKYEAALFQRRTGDSSWEKGLSGIFCIERRFGWKYGDITLELPEEMRGLRILAAFDGEKDYVKEALSGRKGVTLVTDAMTRRFVDLGVTMGDDLGPCFSYSTFAPLEVLLSEGNVEVSDLGESKFWVISKVRGPGVPYYELEVELHDSGLPEHLRLVFVDGTKRTVTRELRVEQFSEKFGYVFPTSFTLSLGSRSEGKFEIDPESIAIVDRPRRDMFRLDTTEGEWAHFENAPKTIFEREH